MKPFCSIVDKEEARPVGLSACFANARCETDARLKRLRGRCGDHPWTQPIQTMPTRLSLVTHAYFNMLFFFEILDGRRFESQSVSHWPDEATQASSHADHIIACIGEGGMTRASNAGMRATREHACRPHGALKKNCARRSKKAKKCRPGRRAGKNRACPGRLDSAGSE
ncbi:hypothetical protein WOA01_16050 [Methylocystis sp. IM2]|uniref:hypothetical protein n=1 Tax=Methylocystis sp. IM2 TaxID=3136563 RepID=UPI0030F9710D